MQTQKQEPIRTLFSRNHTTIFPGLGVFLAGPTPPNGEMLTGWRRTVIDMLCQDERLNPTMTVVSPEPESGYWQDIDMQVDPERPQYSKVCNKQIEWEWQYLNACDITAFWLPTYWNKEKSENFAPNIGPTSRWEFGYYIQEYLKNPKRRTFIVGAPEDAESIKWAQRLVQAHRLEWHVLPKEEKDAQVANSFVEAIAQALLKQKYLL